MSLYGFIDEKFVFFIFERVLFFNEDVYFVGVLLIFFCL